ncbi:flagellar assembly peptidoglycan hydrolase FlgJ [Polynucleobacter sp. CS-Odin-A6]|uniref:flagellar assembly peptidoglycan hydrolase FlgJ n=1 Tax=Polynucleobacter sp. CS-Odin-A6 TaxID=2689106 RepID=UPI001C0C3805|nr:flagellar assembly peptidoglycan hydrolase FlgJ [Polynucleobacter sp. CS-Odin-A6]MBU3621874.1 flagellar assembly peptidoglycan hydrolase FlgJ [Polynucleobacter sp. CS-Odin-A6]
MALSNNTISGTDLSNQLAMDANGLNSLKKSAKENSPEAIKGVAKQFEAIFINMMLKSMRDASPQDGVFNTEQNKLYTSMFDQQLSQKLANGKGIGLADVLVRQLSKAVGAPEGQTGDGPISSKALGLNRSSVSGLSAYTSLTAPEDVRTRSATIKADGTKSWSDKISQLFSDFEMSAEIISPSLSNALKDTVNGFTDKLASFARQASNASGLPAQFMLGQAALETGWGKKEIKGSDGTPSNNLFGIKATGNWNGRVVSTLTTEYINGEKQVKVEKFRAYDSYADSFKDFANLITSNPRFNNVLNNLSNVNSYADAMAKAGYATDPDYAKKLASVIKKISKP